MVLTRWTRVFFAALLVAAGISVGLGFLVDELLESTPQQQLYDQLARLPRTDVLAQHYTDVATRVRSALFDEVAAFDWNLLVPPTYTTCTGPQAQLGGGTLARSLSGGTWSGDPIPKRQWARTAQAVQAALARAGFTSFAVTQTSLNAETLSGADPTGTTLELTLAAQATTFSLQSTCNLLPAAKRPPR